jgi:hypothetical protein
VRLGGLFVKLRADQLQAQPGHKVPTWLIGERLTNTSKRFFFERKKEMDNNDNDTGRRKTSYAGMGISIGAALGMILGMLLFENLALGIGIGVGVGLILGAGMDAQAAKDAQKKMDTKSGDKK